MKLPKFLIKRVPKQANIRRIKSLLGNDHVHTVCESAKCPNIGECFSKNTLTFMILGEICTRNCRFCGIDKGSPLPPDPEEPQKIAEAVEKLGLDYVVITSVTRDDLPDGGAAHFAAVIKKLHPLKVEVLIPDYKGDWKDLKTVLDANPYVLNHNVETVPRLYVKIRPQADYRQSLELLRQARGLNSHIYIKSGFMVGLGEDKEEILETLQDLRAVDCNIVTIGQYLSPSKDQIKVEKYIRPDEFEEFRDFGNKIGLKVNAGPFVRSSFRAKETIERLT